MNDDPTYMSVTNWHWRAWEVCIGITCACIPALRPGYKAVVKSISAYRSRRSSRNGQTALVDPENPSGNTKGQDYKAYAAAAQTFSAEADRAQKFEGGEEELPLKHLPGDQKTANEGLKKVAQQGIKKTTDIDVSGLSAKSSQKSRGSLDLGDVERNNPRDTDFF